MNTQTKDDRVPITLTEQIVGSDRQPEIEAKTLRLVESLARHGVTESNIERGWVAGNDCLIGTGLGNRSELTEEQRQRREAELNAEAQSALVTIARNIEAGQKAGDPQAVADEIAKAVAAKEAELAQTNADALAAKDKELAALQEELAKAKKKT